MVRYIKTERVDTQPPLVPRPPPSLPKCLVCDHVKQAGVWERATSLYMSMHTVLYKCDLN